LEVAGWVEDEFAEEVSGVAFDDADVEVVDEQGDGGCGEASAESDVVQAAVVPQGDGALESIRSCRMRQCGSR
jgi:hypothetical protein